MSEQLSSAIRSVLKVAGGYFVAKGLTDNAHIEELIGAVTTITGFVWSYLHHAAASPTTTPTQTP